MGTLTTFQCSVAPYGLVYVENIFIVVESSIRKHWSSPVTAYIENPVKGREGIAEGREQRKEKDLG